MILSKEAKVFIEKCYASDGSIRSVNPIFKHKYEINGETYTFTEKIFEEIVESNKVKVVYRGKKSVCFMGLKTN